MTGQKTLQNLLSQPPSTLMQNWGLDKLMGEHNTKGKGNSEAEVLSRVGHNASLATILHFSSTLMTEVIESWNANRKLHKLEDKIRKTTL